MAEPHRERVYRVTWTEPNGSHVAYTADPGKANELEATLLVPGYIVTVDRGWVTWGDEEPAAVVVAPPPPEPAPPLPRRPWWRRWLKGVSDASAETD